MRKHAGRPGFQVETLGGSIDARFVVAATGPFQRPVIPPIVPDSAVREASPLSGVMACSYEIDAAEPVGHRVSERPDVVKAGGARASLRVPATTASASADVCGKRPGSARAPNTARLVPATDGRTDTGTHVTFQPASTSPRAIRTATVLPGPGSRTHTEPSTAIACPTASATAPTDDARTNCTPAGNATPAAPAQPTRQSCRPASKNQIAYRENICWTVFQAGPRMFVR